MKRSKTILVAERDGTRRDLLKASLDTQYYEVIWVQTFIEVMQWLHEEPADALILGEKFLTRTFPERTLKTIRRVNFCETLPIVVLASQDNESTPLDFSALDIDRVLEAPLTPKKILNGLREVLKNAAPPVRPQPPSIEDARAKPFDIPVDVHYHSKEAFLNFYRRNISSGRSFVPAAKVLPLHSRFVFQVFAPLEDQPFTVVGTVRSLNLYQGHCGMEVDFKLQNPEDLQRVRQLATEMQRQ